MGMSNWILDRVDEFYDLANKKIGECETLDEFVFAMKPHEHMILGSTELEYVQDEGGYADMWQEYWSKYI